MVCFSNIEEIVERMAQFRYLFDYHPGFKRVLQEVRACARQDRDRYRHEHIDFVEEAEDQSNVTYPAIWSWQQASSSPQQQQAAPLTGFSQCTT